jgi:hypothetical protein
MHIFASFIKQSRPSPYHWTTHGIFSMHVTKLTTNFSRFHLLRIQETDYRPHFTCGRILYFLKHYKLTVQCVNTVRMSANCVCALPQNQQTRHACALSWPQRCSGNILKRNLLSGYPTYFNRRCLQQGIIPKYANIKIPYTSPASTITQKKIRITRVKGEIPPYYL